jgi:tetratricopeptide (TPR) repeat protein
MDEGSYQAAIAVLRRAVAAAAPDSLTYDYALFDLGRSLRLAGDPRDAIPILWRRMQIPNQTAVVREELQLALQALGQSVQQSWGSAGPSASRPHDHGNGPPGGQQGGDQGD